MNYIQKITEPLLVQSYTVLFFVSLIICVVILVSSRNGFTRRAALDEMAVQSAHKGFIPRVGGLAIYISILGLIPLLSFGFIPLTVVFELSVQDIAWLIFTATPIFCIGMAEDLGYHMTPKKRLLASAVSGLLVIMVFKVWVSKLGIPGLDYVLLFAPVGVLFTIFATVGVVNAFNLIDGLNGLSSYVTISTAIALSVISFAVDNLQIIIFLVLISASVFGFMILNFPLGKIFLGDGGAYLLGHLLVWASILMVSQQPSISPFAILLIFFWPVADTGLAIWRRWKLGNPTDKPDRLHFHQLAMRFLEIRFFGRDKRHIVNPIATLVLAPLISVPQILGVLFWHDFAASLLSSFGIGLLFIATYLLGIKLAKRSRLAH